MVREHVEFLFWNQIFSGLDGTCFLSKYVVIRQNIDNELNILLKWGLVGNMKGKLFYSFVILFRGAEKIFYACLSFLCEVDRTC